MCTGLNYTNNGHYFGRNLDLEIDYPVDVCISPRNLKYDWVNGGSMDRHYAMIGMGLVEDGHPLFFEAVNEKGLGMAGLAFAEYAYYFPKEEGKKNIASYELIPYILGQATSVEEARKLFDNLVVSDESVNPKYPASPLHWLIGDEKESIVVESTKDGLHIYDNPFGVLTNAPEFPFNETLVSYFLNVTGNLTDIRFAKDTAGIKEYSRGMGTIGLPGGTDSSSRFVRVAFTKLNSFAPADDLKNVAEFFHILGNVQQVNGESEVVPGQYEITQYTCCANTKTGMFYYSTYYNQSINAVDMNKADLDADSPITYPVIKELQVNYQN